MLQCTHCKRILMDTTSDGGVKLRSRMVLFHEGTARAICPSCKTKNEIPIRLCDVSFEEKPKHIIQKP